MVPPAEHTPNSGGPQAEKYQQSFRSESSANDQLGVQVREVLAILRDLLAVGHDDPDRLFTAEELGALFQLSPRTLKDQAAAGAIAHHRFGKHYRFSRSDIAEILHGSQQAARPPRRSWRAA